MNHFPKNHPKSSKHLRTSSKHSSRKSSKIIQRKHIIPSISPTSTRRIPTKVTIHVVCPGRFGGDEKALTGKPLMKRTMQIWINAADTLLAMIVTKLPSPRPGWAEGLGAGTADRWWEGPWTAPPGRPRSTAWRTCTRAPWMMPQRRASVLATLQVGNRRKKSRGDGS